MRQLIGQVSRSDSPERQFLPLRVVLGKTESWKWRCMKSHRVGMLLFVKFKLINWSVHVAALAGGSGRTHWSCWGRGFPSAFGHGRYHSEVGRLSRVSPFKCFTSDFQGIVRVRGTFNFICDFIKTGLISVPIWRKNINPDFFQERIWGRFQGQGILNRLYLECLISAFFKILIFCYYTKKNIITYELQVSRTKYFDLKYRLGTNLFFPNLREKQSFCSTDKGARIQWQKLQHPKMNVWWMEAATGWIVSYCFLCWRSHGIWGIIFGIHLHFLFPRSADRYRVIWLLISPPLVQYLRL